MRPSQASAVTSFASSPHCSGAVHGHLCRTYKRQGHLDRAVNKFCPARAAGT